MVTTEQSVGRFSVEIELTNDGDLARAEAGDISSEQVRKTTIRGVVDSGAALLVVPGSAAKQLGLVTTGRVNVRYADGHRSDRDIAGRIRLSYGGRSSIFEAIVEPDRDSALIGAIVLEALDMLVDCNNQRLVPRDPDQIISEIE